VAGLTGLAKLVYFEELAQNLVNQSAEAAALGRMARASEESFFAGDDGGAERV